MNENGILTITRPLGIVLGLFRLVQIVEKSPAWYASNFAPHLVKFLAELSVGETYFEEPKSDPGMLSEAVSAFARPRSEVLALTRGPHVLKIIEAIQKKVAHGEALSPFGKALLDDLRYGLRREDADNPPSFFHT
jgi:hypothetical protein